MKKKFGLALSAALLAGAGFGLSAAVDEPGGAVPPAVNEPESRNPDQIPAPPRPSVTKPIERVVTAAPE